LSTAASGVAEDIIAVIERIIADADTGARNSCVA
jgi:hypothetical protein